MTEVSSRTPAQFTHFSLHVSAALLAASLSIAAADSKPDAVSVRRIGNPFLQTRLNSTDLRYARNVWDMHLWDGRIYLGHGNSSNLGPAVNAGPVDVISYDPATGGFATEFSVDDEQIDKFRVVGGKLHIPGHDPRDPWELGNFYVLEKAGWKKIRRSPRAFTPTACASSATACSSGSAPEWGVPSPAPATADNPGRASAPELAGSSSSSLCGASCTATVIAVGTSCSITLMTLSCRYR